MDDMVERLYLRLTEALQRTRRDPYGAPVTVAEIYQELVPYRLVRGEVGFDMNADYEHALLRLLAGEGDRARLEPPHARDTIARELASPNPNVSLYREFAGCDVWITAPGPIRLDDALAAVQDVLDDEEERAADWTPLELLRSEAAGEDAAAVTFSLLDPAAGAPPPRDVENAAAPGAAAAAAPRPAHAAAGTPAAAFPPGPPPAASPAGTPAEARSADTPRAAAPPTASQPQAEHCAFCDSPLPPHRPARFCPYCGHDQATRPCSSCGEPLEAGWVFCVSCGTSGDAR